MAVLPNKETKRMSNSGTANFADPDGYECAFGGTHVQLTVTGRGDFIARLTWLNLRHLKVLRGCEELPRIAYLSLPRTRTFVSFPTDEGPLIWNGLALQLGDIVFHSRGERMYQRTTGEGRWGLISLPAPQLALYSNALSGRKIVAPPIGRVLRPQRNIAAHLLRLHTKACRLAETTDNLTEQPDIAKALEREMLHALVDCLAVDDVRGNWLKRQRHTNIMVRFENALAAHPGRQPAISELCSAVGVPERTLRMCCAEFLGMSPTKYVLLRRLNMVRSALRHADPETASVAEIARSYEFSELGRFAVTYRRIFGEMPSATLRVR
jgi:AraC-like DNA-binding protein